ncbi:helix-turn-helix domain-containing protein [Pseudarthrobacter sulfonivorans]|uniref:helix-turn-helix domain-containing protein n=1 Tax=Pseudarthrobacter sulfonivorans TaxID=121292 RepID=UPI00285D5E66|nr:helix-turn-helix domain-containing protein [Pseudarthrobacter sulfonivorans]MDR6417627.1 AraC-like DNA-binding protein [Pseudarthrobacter sulfonivorans]
MNLATTIPAVTDEMVSDFSTSHLPWQLDVVRDAALKHRAARFGGPWAVDCRLGGMSGRRGQREINHTDGDFAAVLLVRQGREVFSQGGRQAAVGPGTAVMWDGVMPGECFSEGPLVKTTLFLPRQLCLEALPRLDLLVARPLPTNPSLRLLFDWLHTSMKTPDLDEDAAAMAGRIAIDLLSSAIGASSNIVLDSRTIRLMEIKAFIESRLGDSSLAVDDIARANAVSNRYLHALFEGTGETCREFLMRRRRELAYRLLLSPVGVSVTEVAHRCGFDNPSSFSRAFRAAYGISPREARSTRPGI